MSGKSTIDDTSLWLNKLQSAAGRIQYAGVVAGANQAAKESTRAYAGSSKLTVAGTRGPRQAQRISDAMQAGMQAEFKRVSS